MNRQYSRACAVSNTVMSLADINGMAFHLIKTDTSVNWSNYIAPSNSFVYKITKYFNNSPRGCLFMVFCSIFCHC